MLKRNLLAPRPPSTQLTDRPSKKMDLNNSPLVVVTVAERTPSQEYTLRRQLRRVAYRKQREDFFEGKSTVPQCANIPPQQATLDPQNPGSNPFRSPSRYLKALWKFEPEREAIVRLIYSYSENKSTLYNGTTSRIKVLLSNILQPIIKLAHLKKERYIYASAKQTEDNCCNIYRR